MDDKVTITARWNEFTGVGLETKGVEAIFKTFEEAFDAAVNDCCGDNGIVKVSIESAGSIVFSAEYSIPHQVNPELRRCVEVMQRQWTGLVDYPSQEQVKRCNYCFENDIPINAVQTIGTLCSYCLDYRIQDRSDSIS